MSDDPYRDEQLVELYDLDNPAGADHRFIRRLADDLGARRILDYGCGTGLLTRTLVAPDREVIGVDPSRTMLEYARRQPGADTLTWVDGNHSVVPATNDVDLVISSGNTMMHVGPEALGPTLSALAAALRRGGTVCFDTRNPAVREWRGWTRAETEGERDTTFGRLREWLEPIAVEDHELDGLRVDFDAVNVFADGRTATFANTLWFRDARQWTTALAGAGFGEVTVRGGWADEPVTETSAIMVVRAIRR